MTHAPAPRTSHDPARLRALLAQGRLWLCEIMAWLVEFFGNGRIGRAVRAELLHDLHRLRHGVAGALGLLALRSLPEAPPHVDRPQRPPNAPRGWRRGRMCTPLRGAMRLMPTGHGVRGRIVALARVLNDLDTWIARMTARLSRTVFVSAYVMTCAPADALLTQVRVSTAFADSS